MPWLDECSVCEYPVEGKQLLQLANAAAASFNIPALIGATTLLFLKNDLPSQRKEFPVVHLASLDRVFYLVSEASLSSKLQNELYRQARAVVRRWFSEAPREELLKVQGQLKAELNIFEKVLQLVKDAEEQKKELAMRLLRMFVELLSRDKATVAEYGAKFRDHGLYIYKNKKELFLLNVAYEMEFLLSEQIHRPSELYRPDGLLEYVKMKLSGLTACRRPSVNIESTAFLLRKLFVVRTKHAIPPTAYREFLLQIEEHTDKIFSRNNLELRTGHFAFHMKHSHFFDYLEAIFDPAAPSQFRVIREWKDALARAILDALPSEPRQAKAEDIEETVFFLQLRSWQDFLWNKQEVNEFPFVSSRIVSRLVRTPLLQAQGVEASVNVMSAVEKGEGPALFAQANILERALIFYYMHYYEHFSFFSNQDFATKHARVAALHAFRRAIPREELIELLEFYLLEIELGNYYKVTAECDYENENLVYRLVYSAFIDLLHADLLDCLANFKSIATTKELKRIKATAKYLVLLVRAACPECEVPFICRGCRQTGQFAMCLDCEYLCLGVKLYSGRNPLNSSRDHYFYE